MDEFVLISSIVKKIFQKSMIELFLVGEYQPLFQIFFLVSNRFPLLEVVRSYSAFSSVFSTHSFSISGFFNSKRQFLD